MGAGVPGRGRRRRLGTRRRRRRRRAPSRARHAAGVTPAAKHSAPPQAARKPRRRRDDARPTSPACADAPGRARATGRIGASRFSRVAWRRGQCSSGRCRFRRRRGPWWGGVARRRYRRRRRRPQFDRARRLRQESAADYPAIARRREQQGTVTVKVLVGADGSVERAEISDSSGFDSLDDAALETVRSRWRFVPARHDGLAVESWVLVPIRFALLEANAVR